MRRFIPTIMAGVVLVAFGARGIWGFQQLLQEPELVFDTSGEYRLNAPLAAPYTLWYAATASVAGVYQVGEPTLPVGTRIEITHGGVIVPTTPDATTHSERRGGDRVSVLTFEAKEPGEYLIKVSGFTGVRHFEITKGNFLSSFLTVFGAFGAAMATGALALLLLILALTGIWPKQKPVEPPLLSP